MVFSIPTPTPVSLTDPDWANKLVYSILYQQIMRAEFNTHGAEFRAGTMSADDWAAFQAAWEPVNSACNMSITELGSSPPTDLLSQVDVAY